jgi:hypothetical protein
MGLPQCPGEDSNLHALRAQALNLPRMPIPPPGRQTSQDYNMRIGHVNDMAPTFSNQI